MGSNIRFKIALAAAAAVAFSSSASAVSPDMMEGIPTRVKCKGVNACKGQSACQTIANSCQGQNSCKGRGWLYLDGQSRKEANDLCKKAGGTITYE